MLGDPTHYTFWQLLCVSCMGSNKSEIEVADPAVAEEIKRRGLHGGHIEELRAFIFQAHEWFHSAINEIEYFRGASMVVGDENDLSLAIANAYKRDLITEAQAEEFLTLLNKHMEPQLGKYTLADILEVDTEDFEDEQNEPTAKSWWKFWVR